MKVLVVGATGLTGATTAHHLHQRGHEVTLMSRNKHNIAALQGLTHIQANYIEDDIAPAQLEGFDWLVFAAGADLRVLPENEDPAAFFKRANAEAVPRFFQTAKAAGVKRAVYLGTYYPQVVPEKIATDAYVNSRDKADKGVRELSCDSFVVCSVNPPFIIGTFPGVVDAHLAANVQYVSGQIEGLPVVAPAGGVYHITAQSLAEAIEGALLRGESGKAYLVGDEYLSWKDYFEQFCAAVGKPQDLEVITDEHPIVLDMILYAGRNAVVKYAPDNEPLNYSTDQISAAIVDVVKTYGG